MCVQERLFNLLKEQNNTACPICQENINTFQECLVLPCGHLYCKNCFLDFEKMYKHCSLCQQSFNFVDHSRLYNKVQEFDNDVSDVKYDLYEIMYFYFKIPTFIESLLLHSLEKVDWETILTRIQSSLEYFKKKDVENFIRVFSNTLISNEYTKHQLELLDCLRNQ